MSLLVIINCSCDQKSRSEAKKDLPTARDSDPVDNEKKQVELKELEEFEGVTGPWFPLVYTLEYRSEVLEESRFENPVCKPLSEEKKETHQTTASRAVVRFSHNLNHSTKSIVRPR